MTGCRMMRDKRKVLDGKVPEQKGRLLRLFVFRSPSFLCYAVWNADTMAGTWAMRQCANSKRRAWVLDPVGANVPPPSWDSFYVGEK